MGLQGLNPQGLFQGRFEHVDTALREGEAKDGEKKPQPHVVPMGPLSARDVAGVGLGGLQAQVRETKVAGRKQQPFLVTTKACW